MGKNKISFEEFKPCDKDVVILDTNILINYFYPIDFKKDSNRYDEIIEKIGAVKCRKIISSVQVSEFINRCIRIQFDLYKNKIGNKSLDFKKDYRRTESYKEKMKAILQIIQLDILPFFDKVSDGFQDMNEDSLYRYGFSYDFNDALLAEIARRNKAIIITDDIDFANVSNKLKIVTSNKKLLMYQ